MLSYVGKVGEVDALRVDEVAEIEVMYHEFLEVCIGYVSEVAVVWHKVVLFQV